MASKKPVPTGDGCKKASVSFAHGWLAGRPVRATLHFLAKRLKIESVDIETGKTTAYAGDMDQSACVKQPAPPVEATGLLIAAGNAQPAHLRTTVSVETGEPVQGRLRIQGSDVARRRDAMELYGVPFERFDAIAEFERTLGAPADVQAGVRVSETRTVVAHFDLEVTYDGELPARRVLILSELDSRARGASHTIRTGLSCTFLHCRAGLLGYRLAPDTLLLVPLVNQEYCGGRSCGQVSNGALWMLTPEGFWSMGDLIEANRSPNHPQYPDSENDTLVHWVNADDQPSLDLLVRTESPQPENASARALWVFNAERKLFEPADPVPRADPDEAFELPVLLRMTPEGW